MIILYILTNCVPNMTVTYLLIYKIHMVFFSLKMRKLSLTSQAWPRPKHLHDFHCLVISSNANKNPLGEGPLLNHWLENLRLRELSALHNGADGFLTPKPLLFPLRILLCVLFLTIARVHTQFRQCVKYVQGWRGKYK